MHLSAAVCRMPKSMWDTADAARVLLDGES